jgi:hypothetical protein
VGEVIYFMVASPSNVLLYLLLTIHGLSKNVETLM